MNLYEYSKEDAAQLKKDNWHHPLTSRQSLRLLAKTGLATPVDKTKRDRLQAQLLDPDMGEDAERRQYWPGPSSYVWDRLEEAYAWLDEHADQLPPELTSDRAQAHAKTEVATGHAYDIELEKTSEVDYEYGLYDVLGHACHRSLEDYGRKNYRKSDEFKAHGPSSVSFWADVMRQRGQAYKKYLVEQTRRNYIEQLGMDYGVVVGLNLYEQGVRIETTELPAYERLTELLSYDGQDLTWKVSRGRAKAGSKAYTVVGNRLVTRIDGVQYATLRLIHCLANDGFDPAGRSYRFIDGNPSNLSNSNLGLAQVGEVEDTGTGWKARLRINNKDYHVGLYNTEAEALGACERAHATVAEKTRGIYE